MSLGKTVAVSLIGVVVGVIAEEPLKKLWARVKGGGEASAASAPKSAGPECANPKCKPGKPCACKPA